MFINDNDRTVYALCQYETCNTCSLERRTKCKEIAVIQREKAHQFQRKDVSNESIRENNGLRE